MHQVQNVIMRPNEMQTENEEIERLLEIRWWKQCIRLILISIQIRSIVDVGSDKTPFDADIECLLPVRDL